LKKKYADQFEFGKKELDGKKEEGAEEAKTSPGKQKEDEKPKYDKNTDFFDNITNSTLDEKAPHRGGRGGYRGGRGRDDRGDNFHQRGGLERE